MTAPPGAAASGAAAHIASFWHVGITVRSVEASLDFYRDGLGFQVVSTGVTSSAASRVWCLPNAQAKVTFLQIPNSEALLELFEFDEGTEQYSAAARPWDYGHSHFALYVGDLSGLYARLQARGYRSRSGDVSVIPDGPMAGAKVVYMIDPDGYHVELFERAS
jgi:lactoylglutathione lyase